MLGSKARHLEKPKKQKQRRKRGKRVVAFVVG